MGVYKNAMEVLVEEEVDRQIDALPPRTASYINRLELVACALNQLPPLYATSQQGLTYQLQRGRAKLSGHIHQAVQRALDAVRREPIRTYIPLPMPQSSHLRDVLHQLRLVLKNEQLDWDSLPIAVKRAIGEKSGNLPRSSQYPTTPSSLNYPIPTPLPRVKRSASYSTFKFPQSQPTIAALSEQEVSVTPSSEREPQQTSQPFSSTKNTEPQSVRKNSDFYGWDDPLYKL
jgi:hypothetical protein